VCLGDGLTGGVTQQVRISLETFWRTSSPCSIWAYIFLLLHLAYIFFLLHLAYILFLLHLTSLWCVQVMDSLVVSLSKFTSPLNPLAFKPVMTFGENEKARIATEAVFTVANRYARALHKHQFYLFKNTFFGVRNAFRKARFIV